MNLRALYPPGAVFPYITATIVVLSSWLILERRLGWLGVVPPLALAMVVLFRRTPVPFAPPWARASRPVRYQAALVVTTVVAALASVLLAPRSSSLLVPAMTVVVVMVVSDFVIRLHVRSTTSR